MALETDNNINKIDEVTTENIIERVIDIEKARHERIQSKIIRGVTEAKDSEIATLINKYEQRIKELELHTEAVGPLSKTETISTQAGDEEFDGLEQLRTDIGALTTAEALRQGDVKLDRQRDVRSAASLSPISILNAARKAVPAVNYALGAAGIAAAGAIIIGLLGNGRASIIVFGATFIAMVLLFGFARLVAAKNTAAVNAGVVLLWAVTIFFCTFLFFTATAVAAGWPPTWFRFLGLA